MAQNWKRKACTSCCNSKKALFSNYKCKARQGRWFRDKIFVCNSKNR